MKNRQIFFPLLVTLITVSFAALSAQDASLEARFILKELKPVGFDFYQGMLSWIPVSEKVNVGFARNYIQSSDEYSLVSLTFTSKGKCQLFNLCAEDKGCPCVADAVWLEGDVKTQSMRQIPEGLLFVVFSSGTAMAGKEMTLSVARFDENGLRTSDWVDLDSVEATSDHWAVISSLGVSVGEGCIGVTYCVVTAVPEFGFKSYAYFLRTDLQGMILNKPVALEIRPKTKYQYTRVFRTAWNGARWLVPVANHSTIGNQAFVFSSKDEKARKFRATKFVQDKLGSASFEYLNLVPAPSPSLNSDASAQAKGIDYLLFVEHFYIDYLSGFPPTDFVCDYHLYPINPNGKPGGSAVRVMIPTKGPIDMYRNVFSNIIPSYGLGAKEIKAQENEDCLYLAQTVNSRMLPKKINFYVLAVNPADGSVSSLAHRVKRWVDIDFLPPSLQWNGKYFEVINNGVKMEYWMERGYSYFSRFNKY